VTLSTDGSPLQLGCETGTARAVLGEAIDAALGAGTAEPTYACPAKLRLVLQPDSPPR